MSGSFSLIFKTSLNTVSCAKYGTSVQTSPSDSLTDIISIIFESDNTILSYCLGDSNVNFFDLSETLYNNTLIVYDKIKVWKDK